MIVTTEVRVTTEKHLSVENINSYASPPELNPAEKLWKGTLKKITVRALSKQFPYWICYNWLKPFFPFPH